MQLRNGIVSKFCVKILIASCDTYFQVQELGTPRSSSAELDKTKAGARFEYPAKISLFAMTTAQGKRGECESLR